MSILTVRQLTAQIKDAVESGFPYVWVRGEVTNVSRPSSGHIYFSLKDENALLQAVWFKGSQKERETFDPLTGEVFEDGPRMSLAGTLRNGQQVICAGRLTVYAPRGGYQLVVELAQDSGEGQLHLALEALKRKLAEKGYFSLERKRPIPEHPHRVAVITAPSGAAIRDFLRLSGERGTGCEIRIHPVPVQGDDAPPRIAEALDDENRRGWADVLVLIRGGGSLQDLWAFNDERVARAIYDCETPIISAVGHEPDVTIADFVADARASTPSNAAEIAVPDRNDVRARLTALERGMTKTEESRLSALRERLTALEQKRVLRDPMAFIADKRLLLDYTQKNLASLAEKQVGERRQRFAALCASLHAMSPLAVLARGYAVARTANGTVLRSADEVTVGETIDVTLGRGSLVCTVNETRGENNHGKKL